jgi:diguanylate cyclase (GGDEF)-like protein
MGMVRPRTDLVREIKRQQEVLEHQAFHDRLTGLANRALLVQRIEEALSGADGTARAKVAVLFLDLDDFKTINDGHGHRVGDQVLLAVGRRIEESAPGGTAARIGGDEFAVLLDDAATAAATEDAGARMLERIREPLIVGTERVTVHASMGIALADHLGDVRAEDLIHNADLAMYRAKAGGKGRLMLYEASMHRAVIERATLIAEIRTGLDRREFVMHYQPIVELATGRVVAVEALVRWQHPNHGLLSPGAFIGLAEESDLIVPLGTGALHDACRDVQSWHGRRFSTALGDPAVTGPGPAPVAFPDVPIGVTVNLSTRQFREPNLVDEVVAALRTSGLPAERLTLEITESIFMNDVETAIDTLGMLRALGVHISVDDFGTGFSSLSYLQRLPVDALKIDMSFIDRIATGGAEDVALVRTIIALGASLNLAVIAEGIEEAEQREILVGLSCPLGQGYHFGRPISREETERLLEPSPRRADLLIDQP